MPHLTVEMAAVIQGFPAEWFAHSQPKTHKYRQVGNAFPPPVAEAIGRSIAAALLSGTAEAEKEQARALSLPWLLHRGKRLASRGAGNLTSASPPLHGGRRPLV